MAAELDITKLLAQLEHALANPERILLRVSASLAEESINLIKDGFRTETDPYGDKWAPKKARDGRLTLSGPTSRLKGGWHRKRYGADGFLIAPAVNYAGYHQDPGVGSGGELRRPRRMMVPDGARGLPKDWTEAFTEAANDIIADALRGGW